MMSKHLTYDDRVVIETQLSVGATPSEIAGILGKARSTIGREILKHRQEKDTGAFGRVKNRCIHRRTCTYYGCCTDRPECSRKCAACSLCNSVCSHFQEELCPKLARAPYVCNGCPERPKCTLRKFVYHANRADQEYRATLSGNRQGFNLTTGELRQVDRVVSPLIKNGQSIHHICVNNADQLPVGERTIQRMMHSNLLSAGILDQRRVCKLKPRKGSRRQAKVDKACRTGRTIEDFRLFMTRNPDCPHVQMDSVIGKIGGKVLLTLTFPGTELMLAFLRDNNTASTVASCFRFLYEGLGKDDFERLFPVLLTDNGTEFSDPTAIEFDPDGLRRCRVFYCDPMASYQKPHVERNHEFLRMILPKGTSFDHLTQQDINLVLSHINSYKRRILGDKSPFEMFTFLYGEDLTNKLLRLLCLDVVPCNQIILKPKLLAL